MNSQGNKKKEQTFKKIVFVNAFVVGAVIMALEMTGSRFLTPFFGSSVYTWASIISMVLLSLAIGYFWGGRLAEKMPDMKTISLLILFSAFSILLIPTYYEALFKWLYGFFYYPKTGGFFGALLTLFVPLLLLGMYSPFSVKLLSKTSERTGKIAGSLYAVSTIGSILGTIGVTFFLIPVIGSKAIVYSLSFISFLSAVSLTFLNKKGTPKIKAVQLTLFSVYLFLFVFIALNKPIKTLIGLEETKSKYLLEEVESDYNTITIKQKGEYITMSFQRNQAGHIESKINLLNEFELPLSYSQLMQAGLLYQTNPKSLLMVGLGGGSISTYLKSYFPELKITGVELDADVINLSKKYFNLKEDSALNIINEDGRLFLSHTDKSYDLIMLDAYKGGYIPFHLCTDEFYKLVNKHLNKTGLVVLNLHRGSKLFNELLFTLNNTFKYIDLYASKTKGNVVAVAYNQKQLKNESLAHRADSLQHAYNFYHSIIDVYKHKVDTNIKEGELLTDDFSPVNFLHAIKEYNQK